jgi:flagellar hook capping protein FlgD
MRIAVSSDTIGVGFLATSADPNKVHLGGVWDFDTPYYADDISGTDSSQFWTFVHSIDVHDSVFFPTPQSRPFWYYDWGNNINAGDHNLWMSRVGKRVFRRTGLAGVWHEDDLSTVPDTGTISPGFAHNITGSGSAWCGLRLNGDPNAPVDPYTGNAYTTTLQLGDIFGDIRPQSHFPGYASQWDQLLYRDFPYDPQSPGTVTFDYRAELDSIVVPDPGGAGWFTPDPSSMSNFVYGTTTATEPVDSFEVWVGAPREAGVYDSVHRYLSDTIDFGLSGADAPKMILSLTGVRAGSAAPAIPGNATWSTVRVVFRVKTDRYLDDWHPGNGPVGTTTWNSTTGAIVIDNVNVNGTVSDFETPGQILPRFTWTPLDGPNASVTENSPSNAWITTGREAARYGHIHNLGSLPFAPVSSGCDLTGNIAVQSNHDDPHHYFVAESHNLMVSPTICLTGPRATGQGIPPTLRTEASSLIVVFDTYTGKDVLSETGTYYQEAVRFMGSAPYIQSAGPKLSAWDPFNRLGGVVYSDYPDSICMAFDPGSDLAGSVDFPHTDSLQVCIENWVRCTRFSATACGKVDGEYIDNIQIQFVRDQPFTGIQPGEPTLDFVRGAYPNPSADGSATVKFSLSRAVPVTVRFFDLRGALVHEAQLTGKPGENQYRWDGTTRTGASVASGVYFYRLYADGVEFLNNMQRVVFLGKPDR